MSEPSGSPSGESEASRMAEGEGFEPPARFPVQWCSRPPPSTTPPSLRHSIFTYSTTQRRIGPTRIAEIAWTASAVRIRRTEVTALHDRHLRRVHITAERGIDLFQRERLQL